MTDIADYIKVLQDWKDQTGKIITSVLIRINETKVYKGTDLDEMVKAMSEFHREIGRADESLIDIKWFEYCIKSKSRLKKLQEAAEKQKKREPILEKKMSSSVVIYPELLTEGKGTSDERILKYIFKSFVNNF